MQLPSQRYAIISRRRRSGAPSTRSAAAPGRGSRRRTWSKCSRPERAMHDFRVLVRYAVFAVFVLSVVVAFTAWLVRARRVSPFGALGRALRAASDPLIRPVEM